MRNPTNTFSDVQVEKFMGRVLQIGVLCSAAIVLAGGIVFLAQQGHVKQQYGVFRGEPSEMRGVVGIFRDAFSGGGRGIVQLGLLLLIATPVARVIFSVFAFAMQRDTIYVVASLVVLAILAFSMFGNARF